MSVLTAEQKNILSLLASEAVIADNFYLTGGTAEAGEKIKQLRVDSLIDIAVNKLFTIYQKPRSRDFIDLYCILEKQKEWTLAELIDKARAKFDYHIDLLQLASQFVKADTLKDYPTMLKKLETKIWQKFFMKEAAKLSADQLG